MLFPFSQLLLFSLSKEDNKDDKEDDEDKKDLDHQPAVGGDGLKVFEDLCVGGLHVQLGVLHISVDPVREARQAVQWDRTPNSETNYVPVYVIQCFYILEKWKDNNTNWLQTPKFCMKSFKIVITQILAAFAFFTPSFIVPIACFY